MPLEQGAISLFVGKCRNNQSLMMLDKAPMWMLSSALEIMLFISPAAQGPSVGYSFFVSPVAHSPHALKFPCFWKKGL